ncbi:MAG: ATP-binding protein, partial [Bacteroidetes bacterium]
EREGRVDVFVERLADDPGRAAIRIRDNGKGIPEELRERIFVPNFTTKSSGSGLGLAICRNLIQAMDGDIYFISEEGQGTEFVVELPLVDEKTALQQMETQTEQPARDVSMDDR